MRRRLLGITLLALPFFGGAQAPEVDVNTASRAQLESLPGVGPALAARLVAARPFSSWADLIQRVPGIKSALARKLSSAGLRVAAEPFSE